MLHRTTFRGDFSIRAKAHAHNYKGVDSEEDRRQRSGVRDGQTNAFDIGQLSVNERTGQKLHAQRSLAAHTHTNTCCQLLSRLLLRSSRGSQRFLGFQLRGHDSVITLALPGQFSCRTGNGSMCLLQLVLLANRCLNSRVTCWWVGRKSSCGRRHMLHARQHGSTQLTCSPLFSCRKFKFMKSECRNSYARHVAEWHRKGDPGLERGDQSA